MNKLTRKGIAYDFKISPYKVTFIYNDMTEITYTFSSEYYRKKFKEQFEEHREKINCSLSNRFGLDLSNNLLNDLVLYKKIEKRGFRILINGVAVECPENLSLYGMKPQIKSLQE